MEKAAKPDWGGPATLQKEGTSTSTSGVLPLVPETRWKWQQARTAHHWHCTSKQCLPCFLKPPPCNCFYSQDKLHPKLHTETPSQISHYTFWQNRTRPLIPTSLCIFEWIFFFLSVWTITLKLVTQRNKLYFFLIILLPTDSYYGTLPSLL